MARAKGNARRASRSAAIGSASEIEADPTLSPGPIQATPRAAWVERGTLLRGTWPCATCGDTLRRGDAIRVTITPGGGPNRVQHEADCLAPASEPHGAARASATSERDDRNHEPEGSTTQ